MIRRLIIRLIAVLLVVNGVLGCLAVWVGWQASRQLLAGLGEASETIGIQQASLVEAVDGVATLIDDAATTTGGFSQSMTRAQLAVTEGSEAAGGLASIFERLSLATEIVVLGVRPLEPLAEPFGSSVGEFRRLSASLARTGDSLADNARDVTQVAADLRRIHAQLETTSSSVKAFKSSTVIDRSLGGLDLGAQLLLGVLFLEAALSGLTGIALLMLAGLPSARSPRHLRDTSDPNVT